MIEYTQLNVFISELKVYCSPDKFYGRSKFGQYDKEKNRFPLRNAWNRHSGSVMVDTGILLSNMKSPSHECLMTFWSLTNSDFPTNQTFHQFHDIDYRAWPSPIMSGFHGAFATGVACQQRTLTLPDTWFRPPLWDLLVLQLLRPDSANLPCLYPTFHLEWPLVLSRFCFARQFRRSILMTY